MHEDTTLVSGTATQADPQRGPVWAFDRLKETVTATPIGESIVIRARRIIEEVDQICDLARQDEGLQASTLRLGIIPTLTSAGTK